MRILILIHCSLKLWKYSRLCLFILQSIHFLLLFLLLWHLMTVGITSTHTTFVSCSLLISPLLLILTLLPFSLQPLFLSCPLLRPGELSQFPQKQTDRQKKQAKQTLKSYTHLKPTVAEDCNIQTTDQKHSMSPYCSCGLFGRLSSPMFIGKGTLIPCF